MDKFARFLIFGLFGYLEKKGHLDRREFVQYLHEFAEQVTGLTENEKKVFLDHVDAIPKTIWLPDAGKH